MGLKRMLTFVGRGCRALSSASLPSRGREVRTSEADRATGRSSVEVEEGIFGGSDGTGGGVVVEGRD